MLRRIRYLRISLAAKCQLLFGTAVIIIISAALLVPWQRMEQLTDQINERAARMLCDDAIADHLAGLPINVRPTSLLNKPGTTRPAEDKNSKVPDLNSNGLATTQSIGGRLVTAPHLTLLWPVEIGTLNSFEKRALKYFNERPVADTFSKLFADENAAVPEFRYVRVLRNDAGCTKCHLENGSLAINGQQATFNLTGALRVPTTQPGTISRFTTGPMDPPKTDQQSSRIVGLVSIDMRSQLDTNQLLLNRVVLLLAGAFAGTLAIFVLYYITSRLILQPVRVLQETAEKVSKGDLNIRSHIMTGDEFETLSKTLNTMLANLKDSEDQLRATNRGLDVKVSELAQVNVALYEANRLKSEFLANVSHELRTPLNSILGFAELLRDMNNAEPRQARYIQNILGSGRSLLELINDLLDLAKIEAGKMEVRSEPLSLNDLFEGLCNLLKPLSEKKNLSLMPNVELDVPIVHTDPAKIRQVLYNLLSNAIKFSPDEGRIEIVAARLEDGWIKIRVIDQGPGIHPAQQQIIFEKFRQIDGSVTREHGGTGLGLAISKELIGLLGGTMGVDSVLGHGATFWLRLPVKINAGQQDLRGSMVLN